MRPLIRRLSAAAAVALVASPLASLELAGRMTAAQIRLPALDAPGGLSFEPLLPATLF